MYYRVGKKLEPLGVPLPDGGAHPLLALMSPEELRREGPVLGFAERTIQECGNIRLSKIESLYGYLFEMCIRDRHTTRQTFSAYSCRSGT